jgi:class 3 adenylate cyclase
VVSADPRFELVVQAGVDPEVIQAMKLLVAEGSALELSRVNVLRFAAERGLKTHAAIAGFLRAAHVGLFEIHWNVTCPGCGGVLDAGIDLKTFSKDQYPCALCNSAYEPTLDELVEVVFSVSPSVRKLPAHQPDSLGYWDYCRTYYFSSGLALPEGEDWASLVKRVALHEEVLVPGERATLSFTAPPEFLILFEPVTHTTHFLDVKGEPTADRQELAITYARAFGYHGTFELRPGPLRLSLENRTDRRLLPGVFRANDDLHGMMQQRQPFLTAKHVLSSQVFRDLYKASALTVDQRLKIASLTFLFTDLRGSTELYERVGDLAAYDLVREHFRALAEVVRAHDGAVVKTIGDAVMATFPTPRDGLSAALGMHSAMSQLNRAQQRDDLVLKIGIHEGPCLAVTLNDRLDYFGSTVNVAARVQALANPWSIYVTEPVVRHDSARSLLEQTRLVPTSRRASLRGIRDEVMIYEIVPPGLSLLPPA